MKLVIGNHNKQSIQEKGKAVIVSAIIFLTARAIDKIIKKFLTFAAVNYTINLKTKIKIPLHTLKIKLVNST